MKATDVVSMETLASAGKVRIEFANGQYAYLTAEQIGEALYEYCHERTSNTMKPC